MTRDEAILLVSRALSIFLGIFGLQDATYLPERLFGYLHYVNEARAAGAFGIGLYLPAVYRIEVAFLFVRIAIYLLLAVVFWRCAPWIQNTLLPEREV